MATLDGIKFCSADQVRAMQPGLSNLGSDEYIDSWIVVATAEVQRLCRRWFVKQIGIQEFFNTDGSSGGYFGYVYDQPRISKFWLREPEVTDVSVYLSSTMTWNDCSLLVLNTDYILEQSSGNPYLYRVVLRACTRELERAVRIVYTGGYPASPTDPTLILVPSSLAMATAVLSYAMLSEETQTKASSVEIPGVRTKTFDNGSKGNTNFVSTRAPVQLGPWLNTFVG